MIKPCYFLIISCGNRSYTEGSTTSLFCKHRLFEQSGTQFFIEHSPWKSEQRFNLHVPRNFAQELLPHELFGEAAVPPFTSANVISGTISLCRMTCNSNFFIFEKNLVNK